MVHVHRAHFGVEASVGGAGFLARGIRELFEWMTRSKGRKDSK